MPDRHKDPVIEPLSARWWKLETADGGPAVAQCGLCFHRCRIAPGKSGLCGVRHFDGVDLTSPCLGWFSACAVDPVEKKPLYHWRPGSSIFSLGSVGCTMRCPFCQNHNIAQPQRTPRLTPLAPAALVRQVKELGLSSVAYTYNEPALQAEYILEAAPLLNEQGIASVLVTNGMMGEALLDDLLPWTAAANIDLKTFNRAAYAKMGGSLSTVIKTITRLVRAGVHVELTTLVVPGISDDRDDFTRMIRWIADLSPEIPLHLSRYFPAHTFTAPATDITLLKELRAMATSSLKHVHLGNVRA